MGPPRARPPSPPRRHRLDPRVGSPARPGRQDIGRRELNAWAILVLAGLLETAWALGLKYSDGFTRPVPSVLTVAGALLSFWLLSLAMRTLPVGTAYAVWVGIGAVGTAIAAVYLFGEPVNLLRVLGVLLILAGIVALKFAGG